MRCSEIQIGRSCATKINYALRELFTPYGNHTVFLPRHSHHAAIKSQHVFLSDSSVATRAAASLNHDFNTTKCEVSNKSTS